MRTNGRHKHDRLRAMRFALWAQYAAPDELRTKNIAALLDISLGTATKWRKDWLAANSPLDIEGIPRILTPSAATGTR